MPQKNIWDFYTICKKKLDRQHNKKLNQNRTTSTINATGSSNQFINSTKLNNDKLLLDRLDEKINEKLKNKDTLNDNHIRILNSPSKKLINDNQIKLYNSPSKQTTDDYHFRIISSPIKKNQFNSAKQAKISIDNETRQIILKSKTIIDQTKSILIKNPDYLAIKDDFIFKKPLSPAPRVKRKLDLDNVDKSFSDTKRAKNPQQQSILRWTQSSNDLNNLFTSTSNQISKQINEQTVASKKDDSVFKVPEVRIKKRLFNSNDDLKSKIINNSNDEFLNKLKNFQEKKSITNRFNVSFYSPSKRMEDQNERRQQTKELINCSPNKFNLSFYSPSKQNERKQKALDKLISYSPKKFLENKLNKNQLLDKNENQPPQINLSNSLSLSFNQSPLKNQSPLRTSKLIENNKLKKELNANNVLSLPDSYTELTKIFSCLETIVAVLYNRSETCFFNRVKSGIEKLTKKEFTHKYLAQIVTIYPSAYQLSYDLITNRNTNESPCKSNQQLVIKPNVVTIKMTPFTTQVRTNEFKNRLLQFARQKHDEYLLSLEVPIIINSFEVVRWHPSFRFPIIPEAKLPEEPVNKSPTRSPVSKFWEARLKLNNMENNNLENPKKNNSNDLENQDTPKLMCSIDTGNCKIKDGILKGLSQSFLEKVKNKSLSINLAADKSPKKSPEIEKKINEIKKIPALIRTIHSLFTIEKKKTIKLSYIIEKCTENLLAANISELIYKINELLPDWLLILKTSQGIFIKINMETVLQTLYDRLDKILIELENN